ncbi:hypothetical protein M747DRAFT_361820 [Aspergillus niger ATCC 13496]|uniref:Uncharacterized protein n=3 Tax=Aspergillus niger TaxID=5061 RepID=A2QQ92_ASPNC|nr:hypothetical protein An08g01690 [Aspergillus niger]RDH23569.1 hypothetical protein M747DRAFT_361820 [Aspergillus niger ATCC 13496]CAK39849.1 hypothetical protein An08g01690 [Aspergillus niger]
MLLDSIVPSRANATSRLALGQQSQTSAGILTSTHSLLNESFGSMRLRNRNSKVAKHQLDTVLSGLDYPIVSQLTTRSNNSAHGMVTIGDGASQTRLPQVHLRADISGPENMNRNWIPHWSYQKSSIAAACIFTAVTVMALTFLAILSIKKAKRSWERHKREKRYYTNSGYSALSLLEEGHEMTSTSSKQLSRETLMFSKSRSPSSPLFVEQDGPSVTRVYQASKSVSTITLDSPSSTLGHAGSTTELNAIPERPASALKRSRQERHGSKARSVVVVPSPLRAFSVKPMIHHTDPFRSLERTPLNVEHEGGSVPSSSKRDSAGGNSLFKLPAIQRTMSPLFSF